MIVRTAQTIARRPDWHLNRRWTLADIDLVERRAVARASASEIAARIGATRTEICELCERNGIKLWSRQ